MNVNDHYFDGYYKDIWKAIIPAELTIKEVDFMLQHFHLRTGSTVLDLMCGYGRHTIALAEKGMIVTAVDNLTDYTDEIRQTALERSLPIETITSDALLFDSTKQYDLVICMGNSLNFFNAEDTRRILFNIASALKPGGSLLISSWSIAEIAIRNFKEKAWSYIGELKYLTDSKFLFQPARIETESMIINGDGHVETKSAIDYIFTIAELEAMLALAGFNLKDIYSIPGRKKFTLGEPRIYLVAQKL